MATGQGDLEVPLVNIQGWRVMKNSTYPLGIMLYSTQGNKVKVTVTVQ